MSIGFNQTSIELIELPELPEEVPYVFDDCSLAFSLGFRNKIMWHLIENWKEQYEVHRIPKKSGGFRVIHAPNDIMKLLLSQIHVRYLVPLQAQLGKHVTAYRTGLSCRQAVLQHVAPCPVCDASERSKDPPTHDCPRRGLYIHLDLKDFFTSTSRAMVRRYLSSAGYNHDVAGLLANLLTVEDFPNKHYAEMREAAGADAWVPKVFTGVPQGSPASGTLCNLVADQLIDQSILEYLEVQNTEWGLKGTRKWVYTRYCDDLSFTCGKTASKDTTKEFLEGIRTIIRGTGYRVNPKKTRIAHGYYARRLLGMGFTDHLTIPKSDYYRIRALTHNCLTHGFESQAARAGQPDGQALVFWLRGKINHMCQINPQRMESVVNMFDVATTQHEEVTHA